MKTTTNILPVRVKQLEQILQQVIMLETVTQTEQQKDAQARNDPDLRLQMVALVDDLAELIAEHATQLVEKWDTEGNPFAFDRAGDLLIWQLSEYLTQSHTARHPDGTGNHIPQAHQLTDHHAATWFNVEMDNEVFFVEKQPDANAETSDIAIETLEMLHPC